MRGRQIGLIKSQNLCVPRELTVNGQRFECSNLAVAVRIDGDSRESALMPETPAVAAWIYASVC